MGMRAVGLGLAALAGLALVACGSDDERLTAAELTTRGDAVCKALQVDALALGDSFPVSITFTPEQMQDYYTKLLPLVDKAVAGFKALEPPKDLEGAFDSALTQVAIDRTTLKGATSSPAAAKNLFDTGVDPFTATNQKLAAAGITACGGTPPADGSGSTTSTTAGATSSTTAGSSSTTGG